jgi:anti-anti-sigma factor
VNNFTLSSKSAEDVAVMNPKGYINDMGAERLEVASDQFLVNGSKNLVVNFAEVQYINTIGVSVFTGIIQKTLEHNSMLCFTNMKKIHRDVFEMMDLIKYVKVFRDEEDALIYFEKEKAKK